VSKKQDIFTDMYKARAEAAARHKPEQPWAIIPLCMSRYLLVPAAKTDTTLALWITGDKEYEAHDLPAKGHGTNCVGTGASGL